MLRSFAHLVLAGTVLLGLAAERAAGAEEALEIRPQDRILGRAEAPVTIIEYASLTCPHCAHFHETTLPRLRAEWIDTGRARLVFRHYPLDKYALDAAMLAECMPGERFFEFIAMLFEQQGAWAADKDPPARLAELGVEAGLSRDAAASCLLQTATADRIVALAWQDEKQLGVNATPTFFVQRRKIDGDVGFDGFDALLREAESR
jgi:protein-disulfide isomerase